MLKKLICFLLGHITVVKEYTGESMKVTGPLGNEYTTLYYRMVKPDFCHRCGQPTQRQPGDEREGK